jgi:hypothetical protein
MTDSSNRKDGSEPCAIDADVVLLIQRILASIEPISMSAAIFHDLGIAGDDAHELLKDVTARFGTSFAGLDFHSYFPEFEAFVWHWASRLGFRPKHKVLTVAHLVAAIERGSWFEPPAAAISN